MDERNSIYNMSLENNFFSKFGDNLSTNVNLSNYSWFNLGGNAEYFYKAQDKVQLLKFLKESKKNNLKITVLGAGSNTLFRDKGVKGVVVKLGQSFSYIKLIEKNIKVFLTKSGVGTPIDQFLGPWALFSCDKCPTGRGTPRTRLFDCQG